MCVTSIWDESIEDKLIMLFAFVWYKSYKLSRYVLLSVAHMYVGKRDKVNEYT